MTTATRCRRRWTTTVPTRNCRNWLHRWWSHSSGDPTRSGTSPARGHPDRWRPGTWRPTGRRHRRPPRTGCGGVKILAGGEVEAGLGGVGGQHPVEPADLRPQFAPGRAAPAAHPGAPGPQGEQEEHRERQPHSVIGNPSRRSRTPRAPAQRSWPAAATALAPLDDQALVERPLLDRGPHLLFGRGQPLTGGHRAVGVEPLAGPGHLQRRADSHADRVDVRPRPCSPVAVMVHSWARSGRDQPAVGEVEQRGGEAVAGTSSVRCTRIAPARAPLGGAYCSGKPARSDRGAPPQKRTQPGGNRQTEQPQHGLHRPPSTRSQR